MDPGIVSAMIAGGASLAGSTASIAATSNLNKKNRQWQEKMTREAWGRDDTAVQRRAEDMEAAGINRLVAGGGGSGALMQSGMANTVQGQTPDLSGIRDAGAMAANAMKSGAEAAETSRITAFERGNEATRREIMQEELRGMRFGNDKIQQEMVNLASQDLAIHESILHSEAQRELLAEQTNRERQETLRVMKASELITEQIRTELTKQGLNENQSRLAIEKYFSEVENTRLLRQEVAEVTARTRVQQISAAWLEEEKIQTLTNARVTAISQMISAVSGAFKGGAAVF